MRKAATKGRLTSRTGKIVLSFLVLAAVASAPIFAGVDASSDEAAQDVVHSHTGHLETSTGPAPGDVPARPNIVFVLTDDLSTNLVPYMPHVLAMMREGLSFSNYTVTDSLCCPSRSSIFSGKYPHDTEVYNNEGPYGGFDQFFRRGEESSTFAVALQKAGYLTGMMGKYLNGYIPYQSYGKNGQPLSKKQNPQGLNYVPPGWSTWDVAGSGYNEFNYDINENHRIATFGHKPSDYGVDVLSGLGVHFISDSSEARKPFMLEIAPFAPHFPYVPAPQDAHSFPNLKAPRDPAFNRLPKNAPRWLAGRGHLLRSNITSIDSAFRLRVQSVQSVDRMIGALEQELVRTGQASNTYFVFSSDNGLHLGEYTFNPGKLTAFDTDIRVPLVVTGPHVPHGVVDPAVVQNIDLAPTFESIGGVTPPATVDGRSLYPLWKGETVAWRRTALTEHLGLDMFSNDPDFQNPSEANPPSYAALRTATYTYVAYRDGEREFYNRVTDPWELDNVYDTLTKAQVAALNAQVAAMTNCHGATACWNASLAAPGPA